jgi:hypothetical protein
MQPFMILNCRMKIGQFAATSLHVCIGMYVLYQSQYIDIALILSVYIPIEHFSMDGRVTR